MNEANPTIHPLLPGRARKDAKKFLGRWIESVNTANIGDDTLDADARQLRAALKAYRIPGTATVAPLPEPAHDLWSAILEDDQIVAVAHAGPQWGQALDIWGQGAADLVWLSKYLTRCWNVDEIAVHPNYRRRGYGRALVRDVQAQARHYEVHYLSAYASSDEAIALFTGEGWTALPPRTPIPAAYAEGLRTVWDPGMDSWGGAWVYRTLSTPGAAFRLPGASGA